MCFKISNLLTIGNLIYRCPKGLHKAESMWDGSADGHQNINMLIGKSIANNGRETL